MQHPRLRRSGASGCRSATRQYCGREAAARETRVSTLRALNYVLDGDAHAQLPRSVGAGDLLHARAAGSWALQWHDQSAGGGAALEGVRVRARARFRYVYCLFPICPR